MHVFAVGIVEKHVCYQRTDRPTDLQNNNGTRPVRTGRLRYSRNLQNAFWKSRSAVKGKNKLEYLAVYGRASSEQCARGSSALNTWSKVWTLNPYMSLFNLKLWTHIWSTNINFRPPPYIGHFGPPWSELSPYGELRGGGGGRLGRRHIFVRDRQKRDYLSCASHCARGATKNLGETDRQIDRHQTVALRLPPSMLPA